MGTGTGSGSRMRVNTNVYSSGDPVRISSLNDVSTSLANASANNITAPSTPSRPRSATMSDNDQGPSGVNTPTRRRPPPVPPSKKLSVNSSGTWSGSEDGSAASSPALGRGDGMGSWYTFGMGNGNGHGPGLGNGHGSASGGGSGSGNVPLGQEELVKEGAKGVPPPIIEVHPAPTMAVPSTQAQSPVPARPGWITFST